MTNKKQNKHQEINKGNVWKFLSKWFIILNTSIWLAIIILIKINDLRTKYVDSATDVFIIFIGIGGVFVYGKGVQKYLDRMNYQKISILALLLGYIHLSLDIVNYPQLNWLQKKS